MNNINSYLDDMLKNKINYNNNYSENTEIIISGGGNDENKPNGGFPPIYQCDNLKSDEELDMYINTKNKREYQSHKNTVTFTDIMNVKKDEIKPFFQLD